MDKETEQRLDADPLFDFDKKQIQAKLERQQIRPEVIAEWDEEYENSLKQSPTTANTSATQAGESKQDPTHPDYVDADGDLMTYDATIGEYVLSPLSFKPPIRQRPVAPPKLLGGRKKPQRFTYEQTRTIIHLAELNYNVAAITHYMQTKGHMPGVTRDAVRQRIKRGLSKVEDLVLIPEDVAEGWKYA